MGRTYLFECPKCNYRVKVSGGADSGLHFAVQTIRCRDCNQLYDAVTSLKLPIADLPAQARGLPALQAKARIKARKLSLRPPKFQSTMNRLPVLRSKGTIRVEYSLQCPASPLHRVVVWNQPGKCPKCGAYLECGAIPFRRWD